MIVDPPGIAVVERDDVLALGQDGSRDVVASAAATATLEVGTLIGAL